jgi:hypothetical protein
MRVRRWFISLVFGGILLGMAGVRVFGAAEPVEVWPFMLYKANIEDGMTFRVEVVDTRNMTSAPVPGVFSANKREADTLENAEKKSVVPSGRRQLALRIRRTAPPPSHAN